MKIPFVDLRCQYESIRAEIDRAMASVLADNAFIGGRDNRYTRAFEESFCEFLGVAHCVSCGNGTDSLEILLKAFGIGDGDEVIVPAHSWISTSECVSSVGARPVFVDTLPDTYTIDPDGIERAVTPATKAIIPVHLYGLPADMDRIMAIAARHGLKVIEDCAQAHGATFRGQRVGTIGHAASFSFYPGKNLGAYGDAGAVVTNDAALAERVRMIGNHGQLKKHDHQIEGRNSRMDGLHAAVLSVKLKHLERWTRRRIDAADYYRQCLAELPLVLPYVPEDRVHVYHLFVVRVSQRAETMAALAAAGIQTGVHYPTPLPALPPYRARGVRAEDFPVATAATREVLSLPMFAEIEREQQAYVASEVARCLSAQHAQSA